MMEDPWLQGQCGPEGRPGLLTVRRLNGQEFSMPVGDEETVLDLRRRLAGALGLCQGGKGLAYGGRILASNREVADLLGLAANDVVRPSAAFRSARLQDVWALDTASCLGEADGESPAADPGPEHLEVDAIACLDAPFGQGVLLLCRHYYYYYYYYCYYCYYYYYYYYYYSYSYYYYYYYCCYYYYYYYYFYYYYYYFYYFYYFYYYYYYDYCYSDSDYQVRLG